MSGHIWVMFEWFYYWESVYNRLVMPDIIWDHRHHIYDYLMAISYYLDIVKVKFTERLIIHEWPVQLVYVEGVTAVTSTYFDTMH